MNGDSGVKYLLGFEKLITPTIIKFLYWAGLAFFSLFAIISFFAALFSMGDSILVGLGKMLATIIGFCFAVLFWRILMEVYIVFFGIHERLGEIRDRLGERTG